MIPRPTKPRADRLRAALALNQVPSASRDWLANVLSGRRQFPSAGPGALPGPGDLARAVAIALSEADGVERCRSLAAIAAIAVGSPELLVPESEIGWHTCGGGRRYRNDDPDSTCAPGVGLAAARAEVARLSAEDRATVSHFAAVLRAANDATRGPVIRRALERRLADGGVR